MPGGTELITVMESSTQPSSRVSSTCLENLPVRVLVVDFVTSSSTSTFFAVKPHTLKSVAAICCINWNHFS